MQQEETKEPCPENDSAFNDIRSFQQVNNEITRQILSFTLKKSADELKQLIPDEVITETSPPCRLERIKPKSESQ